MLLEKEGKLSFQDSVRKFFPDFPYENITIHQLLTHRSGLPNYMYAADEYWLDNTNPTIDNCGMVDLLIAHEPQKILFTRKKDITTIIQIMLFLLQ